MFLNGLFFFRIFFYFRGTSTDLVMLSDDEEPAFSGHSNESVMIVEERTATRGYRRRRAV